MSHEGSVGGKPSELFLSGVSPKKVPPLLLQPPTLNFLSTVRPPLRTSPQVESLRPGSPRPGLFLRLIPEAEPGSATLTLFGDKRLNHGEHGGHGEEAGAAFLSVPSVPSMVQYG